MLTGVGGAEVLTAYVALPPYVAVRNAVPGGSRLVIAFTETPAERVKGPNEPRTVVPSLASAVIDTSPAAAGGATLTGTVKLWPEVPDDVLSAPIVVVVVVRTAEVQFVSRFATLIEPNPVARSYPDTALNAGFPLSTPTPEVSTPNPLVPVLLQFGVPATQATVFVPFVMS
jgi:hypothetical protein